MPQVAITFAMYRGEELVRRETLRRDIIKLGQDPKSHVLLDDPAASRMHAVVEVGGPDDITLIDLGTETGTTVNGVRVDKCKLHSGDRIQIGRLGLVLERIQSAAVDLAQALPAPTHTGIFAANRFGLMRANPLDTGLAGDTTYSLIKSRPGVSSEEVEVPNSRAVEVMVLWGTNVLHVSHLNMSQSFYIGEESDKNVSCDFLLPSEKLGTTRLPLVVGDGTDAALIIPEAAQGTLELPGEARLTLEQARQKAQPCPELGGGHRLALPLGGKARIEIEDFVFQVATVKAGKPAQRGVGAGFESAVFSYFGMSLAAVGGFVAAMAFFVPPLGLTDDETVGQDQLYLIQQYLNATQEPEQNARETEQVANEAADEQEGGKGIRAKHEEGTMGNPTSRQTNRRYAVAGDPNNTDTHISREQALREARNFGTIGLLNSGIAGDPNAPTAPWGRESSLGNDPFSARGNMWGDELGEAYGAGGFGLTGIGEGGGGRGEGIGVGAVGGLGHGAGLSDGQGFGYGNGRLGKGHKTKVFKMRVGQSVISGRLPPEVIQRIVRQNYGRFRMCYEQGLSRNPNLEGRVQVRFVIGRDGAVSNVQNGGSDLPDATTVSCVVSAYYGLSFPQPDGGIVTVVYPIMFQPG